MLELFMAVSIGQVASKADADARAVIAIVLAQRQPKKQTYAEASAEAIRRNVPLVVFIGHARRHIAGAVSCEVESLTGYSGPCVVVGVPASATGVPGGESAVYWRATLPRSATDAEILATFAQERKGVYNHSSVSSAIC